MPPIRLNRGVPKNNEIASVPISLVCISNCNASNGANKINGCLKQPNAQKFLRQQQQTMGQGIVIFVPMCHLRNQKKIFL
jgi:hypothetical protein